MKRALGPVLSARLGVVVLVLWPAAAPAAEVQIREVSVAVATKDGEPLADLTAEEFEVKEDGKKRTVLGIGRDERPVVVSLILDSSQWIGREYTTTLVPAAMEFWRMLPANAQVTIWTSGGRSSHVVDFGLTPEAAEPILKKQAVGGPSFTLDTIIDAARHLGSLRSERKVLVVVTGQSIPYSQSQLDGVYRAIPEARLTPVVILVSGYTGTGGGVRLGGQVGGWDVESFLDDMTAGYGGGYDVVLTIQACDKALKRVAAGLSSQYRVRFESEAERPSRPEVKVDRKHARTVTGLAMLSRESIWSWGRRKD